MKKGFCVLLCVLLLLLGLAGCGGASSAVSGPSSVPAAFGALSTAGGALAVTDMTGREITLDGPATRIVAVSPSDCEILYAIGAEDTLVGRGTYCNYPEEVLDVAAVESGAGLNVEQVIALKPQVVLMTKMAQTVEQVEALEEAGIRVIVSDAQDIAGVYQAIELIGAITGKAAQAQEVADEMRQAFAVVEGRATKDGSETIYFEVSPLEYGLWTAGSGTFMDEIAAMLGLTNAFADVEGWGEISEEQVLERDPDYIVTIAMDMGEGVNPAQEIAGRDGWQGLKAVRDGYVMQMDADILSRPGPRLADAAEALYGLVYNADTLRDVAAAGNPAPSIDASAILDAAESAAPSAA